jgi:DNA-directed RNA polymerase specialized sigma24 family protein
MFRRNCEREPGDTFQLADERLNPELEFADRERMQVANRALEQLSPREREVLLRFYFQYETPLHICAAMDLTETQFRLLKWRAKAKCGTAVRRYWKRKSFFVAHSQHGLSRNS